MRRRRRGAGKLAKKNGGNKHAEELKVKMRGGGGEGRGE